MVPFNIDVIINKFAYLSMMDHRKGGDVGEWENLQFFDDADNNLFNLIKIYFPKPKARHFPKIFENSPKLRGTRSKYFHS